MRSTTFPKRRAPCARTLASASARCLTLQMCAGPKDPGSGPRAVVHSLARLECITCARLRWRWRRRATGGDRDTRRWRSVSPRLCDHLGLWRAASTSTTRCAYTHHKHGTACCGRPSRSCAANTALCHAGDDLTYANARCERPRARDGSGAATERGRAMEGKHSGVLAPGGVFRAQAVSPRSEQACARGTALDSSAVSAARGVLDGQSRPDTLTTLRSGRTTRYGASRARMARRAPRSEGLLGRAHAARRCTTRAHLSKQTRRFWAERLDSGAAKYRGCLSRGTPNRDGRSRARAGRRQRSAQQGTNTSAPTSACIVQEQ